MCVTHIHKAAYELICKLEEQEKQAKCAVLNELKEKVDRCYVGNSMPEIIDEMIEELKK